MQDCKVLIQSPSETFVVVYLRIAVTNLSAHSIQCGILCKPAYTILLTNACTTVVTLHC